MHLIYRSAQASDVEACIGLLPPEFVCPPDLRAALPDVWRQWLRDGLVHFTVVEDLERSEARRMVGFGTSAFVTDGFAAEVKESVPPPLAAQVARRFLDGVSPLLTRDAVARANHGSGLNLLVLIISWAADALTAEEVRWVKAKLLEAFFFAHCGYKLNQVMQEVYSESEMERGRAVGTHLLTDYAQFYAAGALLLPPPDARPYLIGAAREQVRDGSALSPLFFYAPPRFSFKPGEQQMLHQALVNGSDEELAAALHVSLSTIHKRWHAIYERVAAVAPDLLPSSRESQAGKGRGVEKRRHLLSYLRSHLEELRPSQP